MTATRVHVTLPSMIQMRAARELEDLRMEKESLDVMRQQLAAVHQLRIDLQRKDSVIQARQSGGLRKRQGGRGGLFSQGGREIFCCCSFLDAACRQRCY